MFFGTEFYDSVSHQEAQSILWVHTLFFAFLFYTVIMGKSYRGSSPVAQWESWAKLSGVQRHLILWIVVLN